MISYLLLDALQQRTKENSAKAQFELLIINNTPIS